MGILDKVSLPIEMTFGVELECIGDKATEFIDSNPLDFNAERDASLDDVNGIEFISPIMKYDEFDLHRLKDTLYFIKSNGFSVDDSCGGHIHFGASYLENLGSILNLLVIYKYFEKELCAISNARGGRIRRGCSNHASSIVGIMYDVESALKKEKIMSSSTIDESKKIKEGAISKRKSYGLNVRNIGNPEKNTVEFRVPNGTLDEETLKENIILFGSLVKVSKEIFDFYEYQIEVNNLLSTKRKSEKRIELLLNLIFDDKKDAKKIYYERFENNIGDPMLGNLGMKETTLRDYPSVRKVLEKKR